MRSHGPKSLEGPIRGTPGWWQELGKAQNGSQGTATVRKKRSKKTGQHRNYARAAGGSIRVELIERVRREIEAGTYETPEKWEAALDRLLENLRPE